MVSPLSSSGLTPGILVAVLENSLVNVIQDKCFKLCKKPNVIFRHVYGTLHLNKTRVSILVVSSDFDNISVYKGQNSHEVVCFYTGL